MEVTKMDGLATEAPEYGGFGATGMDEGTDVKRSGYAEVTKMNSMAAEALGYGGVRMDKGTTA